MLQLRTIRRALISVSDKTGIVDFARALHHRDIEILSTGGTAKLLHDNHIPVIEVSDYTGYPEMMGGRVKTLHPKIHGGILARRDTDGDIMTQHDIQPIDMVVVNLYPFAETVNQHDCSLAQAIENIDIGGPTMIRAAAKNYQDVAILVNNQNYQTVIEEMDNHNGALSYVTRFNLARAAFEHTAAYDDMIANYLGQQVITSEQHSKILFPHTINLHYVKQQDLRYGENGHQQAAFYIEPNNTQSCVSSSEQLQGKPLSYNNIADTDAALECVKSFQQPACVIVKHANPCGVAQAETIHQAYLRAFSTDPTSAFGGIIAFNRELDEETAQTIIDKQFVEVIIAPKISASALIILSAKQNIRVLACGDFTPAKAEFDFKKVTGGLLVQDKDLGSISLSDLHIVSKRQPTTKELEDALFCWKVVKFVKSNAIVYVKDLMTIGIGAGQMSRVYSAKIASIKAYDEGLDVTGSVMASDAFFPFRDGIDTAAQAGITCVIQPGGSIRDDEIIAAADEHNITMIFTKMRHFRH